MTSLVKKIDAANAKNAKMGSFVIFLSDDEKLEEAAKTLAKKENIKKTVFAIDNPAGPQAWKISKEADVTVIFYNQRKVAANFAFRKGELNEQAVEKVASALTKIGAK